MMPADQKFWKGFIRAAAISAVVWILLMTALAKFIWAWEGVVIHHTATPNGKEYSLERCNQDHRARGFTSCGYGFLIGPDGVLVRSRGFREVGAHARGYNSQFLGIAVVGHSIANRSQFKTLQRFIKKLRRRDREMLVICHKDVGRTLCPGQGLTDQIKRIADET